MTHVIRPRPHIVAKSSPSTLQASCKPRPLLAPAFSSLPSRNYDYKMEIDSYRYPEAPSNGGGPPSPSPRVLSIQSSVVHGYVGNKCAIFPLQILGFDVDPVFSVQFSNHTGYPSFQGQVFDGSFLMDITKGLEENGLLGSYSHMLTGYIGSPSLLERIVDLHAKVREHSGPHLTYVCDPVMGDEGKLYVAPAMVDLYRSKVLPIATVITPNQFEAEMLAEMPIRDEASALAALDRLHDRGPRAVILTSAELGGDPNSIICIASCFRPPPTAAPAPSLQQEDRTGWRRTVVRISVPKIRAYFTGTGDLMTALLLGYLHRHPSDPRLAVEKAVNSLQVVLRGTAQACASEDLTADKDHRTAAVCRVRELRLVQYQRGITDPPLEFRAEELKLEGGARGEKAR